MKIGPSNTILEPFEYGEMSTETHVPKTAPAFYTLPLQTAPHPFPHQVNNNEKFAILNLTIKFDPLPPPYPCYLKQIILIILKTILDIK